MVTQFPIDSEEFTKDICNSYSKHQTYTIYLFLFIFIHKWNITILIPRTTNLAHHQWFWIYPAISRFYKKVVLPSMEMASVVLDAWAGGCHFFFLFSSKCKLYRCMNRGYFQSLISIHMMPLNRRIECISITQHEAGNSYLFNLIKGSVRYETNRNVTLWHGFDISPWLDSNEPFVWLHCFDILLEI